MTDDREKQLIDALSDSVKGLERELIISLIKDFAFLESQIDKLRAYPRYKVSTEDPTKQIKLPVHEIIKDYQAQKNDIATKILRTISNTGTDDSALAKILARFEHDD